MVHFLLLKQNALDFVIYSKCISPLEVGVAKIQTVSFENLMRAFQLFQPTVESRETRNCINIREQKGGKLIFTVHHLCGGEGTDLVIALTHS